MLEIWASASKKPYWSISNQLHSVRFLSQYLSKQNLLWDSWVGLLKFSRKLHWKPCNNWCLWLPHTVHVR